MIITLEFACLSFAKPYKAPMKSVFSFFFVIICMLAALTPPTQACLCFRRPPNLKERIRGAKHFPKIRRAPSTAQQTLTGIKEEPEDQTDSDSDKITSSSEEYNYEQNEKTK